MSDKSYNEMSAEELNNELVALRREQFNLRIQKATSEQVKPHLFKVVRRNIARIKTYLARKAGDK